MPKEEDILTLEFSRLELVGILSHARASIDRLRVVDATDADLAAHQRLLALEADAGFQARLVGEDEA